MSLRRYIVFSLSLAIVLFVGVSDVFAQLNFSNSAEFLQSANNDRTGLSADPIENQAGTIITVALQLVGVAFFFLMVYGGFLWMTDRGNEQQVDQARNTIIAAVIGLVVVLGAYAATNFVVNRFINPVTQSNELRPEQSGVNGAFCTVSGDCNNGLTCIANTCSEPVQNFDDPLNDALNAV